MAGFLDTMQFAGDSLDKLGGRAVRGVLGGHPRELLSPIPFSDRLGITDPHDIVTGRNLTDQAGITTKGDRSLLSHGAGMAADMLLDPGNLMAGAGIMRSAFKQAKAARGIRSAVAAAPRGWGAVSTAMHDISPAMRFRPDVPPEYARFADALGPMYGGGPAKFAYLADNSTGDTLAHLERILGSKPSTLGRLAGEIHPDATIAGAGKEAIAFRQPNGSVVRMAKAPSLLRVASRRDLALGGRPDITQVLQPYRANLIGDFHVEHMPGLDVAGLLNRAEQEAALRQGGEARSAVDRLSLLSNSLVAKLRRGIQDTPAQGFKAGTEYYPWDVFPHNIGLTPEGKAIVVDAGAVGRGRIDHSSGIRPDAIPYPDRVGYPNLPSLRNKLIDMGAPDAVREAMAKGLAQGTVGQGIDHPYLPEIIALRKRLSEILPNERPSSDIFASDWIRALNGTGDFGNVNLYDPSLGGGSPLVEALSRGAGSGGLSTRFRPLRNQFALVKDAGANPRMVGMSDQLPTSRAAIFQRTNRQATKALGADQFRGIEGYYSPKGNAGAIFSPSVAPRNAGQLGRITRHEIGHGIVDQAVKAGLGEVLRLPPAWQVPALAKLAGNKLGNETIQGLGRYLDEIAQYSTQHRNLADQIRGGYKFATSRNQATKYAAHIARDNPLLARLIMTPTALHENRNALALALLGGANAAREAGRLNEQ